MLVNLEKLAEGYQISELASLANDLRICISTLGAVWTAEMKEAGHVVGKGPKEGHSLIAEIRDNTKNEKHLTQRPQTVEHSTSSAEDKGTKTSAYSEALSFLSSPLLPSQAHGLIQLTRLIRAKDKETTSNTDTLLTIFTERLKHDDSYIYLAAINGLVELSSIRSQKVLDVLCREYAKLDQVCSGVDQKTGVLKGRQSSYVIRKQGGEQVEWRLKVGEALVKVVQGCGELLPHYSQLVLSAILSNTSDKDSTIRASSYSNLADVCQLLGHTFTSVQHEVRQSTECRHHLNYVCDWFRY